MMGAGGEPKAGSSIHLTRKVFIEVHKQRQFTCQADTVAGSSLIPSVALLARAAEQGGLYPPTFH